MIKPRAHNLLGCAGKDVDGKQVLCLLIPLYDHVIHLT
jgi:hypothetical protein